MDSLNGFDYSSKKCGIESSKNPSKRFTCRCHICLKLKLEISFTRFSCILYHFVPEAKSFCLTGCLYSEFIKENTMTFLLKIKNQNRKKIRHFSFFAIYIRVFYSSILERSTPAHGKCLRRHKKVRLVELSCLVTQL
jgi:hypothetical protein